VWSALSIFLISFGLAALLVGWLARGPASRLALDEPNNRSLHVTAVPRTGGIGLLLGVAAGWAVAGANLPWAIWGAIALLAAVSLMDDLRGLSAAIRFGAHLVAATLAVTALLPMAAFPWLIVAAILAVGWMCNLYNFMDGSDGLAGGMALCGFSAYAIAAWMAGNTPFALMNLAVAAAAAGFLLHNFHPARIFLGDTGSVTLGFLAAVFGISGWLQRDWTWWFPLLVFSPFIVDASVTLLRRAYARAAVWQAHKDHYYQRLVQMGWGHRRTAHAEYALMLACSVAAIAGLAWSPYAQLALLTTVAVVYAVLIGTIQTAWRKFRTAQQHVS
jgi:UDP-N-acetylmuramyl pentapeptide phosphotransferase/UDP-N-acetylglucosamine-1-phosphate transferase